MRGIPLTAIGPIVLRAGQSKLANLIEWQKRSSRSLPLKYCNNCMHYLMSLYGIATPNIIILRRQCI